MTTRVNRADFAELKGITPKLIRFFEELFTTTVSTSQAVQNGSAATQSIQDATVLTLSPNAAFNNERIVEFNQQQFIVTDGGSGQNLAIELVSVILTNGGYQLIFNLAANTNLDLPASGKVPSSAIGPYADDAAAAAAGVQIGEWYAKTGGAVIWRQT